MIERILFVSAGFFAGLLLAQSPFLTIETSKARSADVEASSQETVTVVPEHKSDTLPSKPIETRPSNTAEVLSVHDGDTITALYNGEQKKVRLIGINAPEIYNNKKTAQCFGREATEYARTLLENKIVRIETDPSQDTYDKYGRLLAYIFLPDGTNAAEIIIRNGYAYEYTYRLPYQYQQEFRAAQQFAQISKSGLWKSGACSQ